ncbi:MAG: ABC transporter ATP-binding protein [Sulfuricurvum sp.]|uniref:ABC transporter ATP-binding protein n=1 Tax=Sulfuricurvum sp. TaxID=2025608 RepID=UPI003D11C671
MDNIAVSVHNLNKTYRLYDRPIDRLKEALHPLRRSYHHDFKALNDVSFEIEKGDSVGIIGKNGAGKSTLLKIITGVLTPTSGSLKVNGRIASLLELGAGFHPEYTGIENIYLQGTLIGYTHAEVEAKLADIIAFADIGEFIYQSVKIYSSGMFARLAFAVAIHVDPDILIVDEALSVGDFAFQYKCFQAFRRFQEAGKTILFVSHSTQQIIQYCNKAILMHEGKMVTFSEDVEKTTFEYEMLIRHHDFPHQAPSPALSEDIDLDTSLNPEIGEHRFGTHEALFARVILSSEEFSENSDPLFHAGKKVHLRFVIHARRDFPSVVIGASLKNKDGLLIWGDNTVDTPIGLRMGLNEITMSFNLNVVAGEYGLFVGLADISGEPRVELDQRWPCQKITIISSHRTDQGFAYAPARITLWPQS